MAVISKAREKGNGQVKRAKNKIFQSYFISYVLIGIFPLVLSLLGNKICQNIITEGIKVSQENILTLVQKTFDQYMEGITVSSQLLSSDDRLNRLAELAEFDPEARLELKKLRDALAQQKNSMSLCEEVIVFFTESGTLVTNDKVYSNAERYERQGGITQESLESALAVKGVRSCIVGSGQDEKTTILFVQNIYNYNYKEKAAVIIISVPWADIQEKTGDLKNGAIYWLNAKGDCLATEELQPMLLPYDAFPQEGELIYTEDAGHKEISSFRFSKYYDWKYCITMSERLYFAELDRMRVVIAIQMIVLVAVAIGMAMFCSWQNYKPIEKMLQTVRKKQRSGKPTAAFSDVEEYIEKLYLDNQRLGNSWEKAKDVLTAQVVTGYLKGWNADEAMVEEILAQKAGIDMRKSYIVFLITLQDISSCKLFTAKNCAEDAESRELLQFVFTNIFQEVVLAENKGVLLPIDDIYLCILEAESGGREEWVEAKMNLCAALYRKHLNLSVFVGGSGWHCGVKELPRAYNEAAQVLSWQSFWGNEEETFVVYESVGMPDVLYAQTGFMPGEQNRLYNLIASREYEKAMELLDEMIDGMLIPGIGYTEVNQFRMFGLMSVVCAYLTESIGRNDEAFLYELHPMERLLDAKTVEAARSTLKDVFADIIRHLEQCFEQERPKWIGEILEYIEVNYQDTNLSGAMLAEKLNMNLAYMGRVFKQHMGYSLPDYIHHVRIRECKILLQKGVSVKEAAEMVGYVDSKALIRIFKKTEGITPGQFKNECDVES